MMSFRNKILLTYLLVAALAACSPAATPTAVADVPSGTKEPCIDISASPASLKVGETTTITGTAQNVESPSFFGLQIRDDNAQDFSMLLNLPAGAATQVADVSQILKFVSADYIDHGRVVVLRANQAGSAKVGFFVSGGSACADPSKGGATSDILIITVNP